MSSLLYKNSTCAVARVKRLVTSCAGANASPYGQPAPNIISTIEASDLALPDSEHLGSAYGTSSLIGPFAIFHCYGLGVFHLPFGSTLHAVSLHRFASSFRFTMKDRLFVTAMSIV